jgi:D-arabinose 1-dehydrogenase-like Zn-dependent alcohol dehydrogenase
LTQVARLLLKFLYIEAIIKTISEMFKLAAHNKLKVETETVKLQDIEKLWDTGVSDGKRLVVTI